MIPGQRADKHPELARQDSLLRDACCDCLDQCLAVVQALPAQVYRRSADTNSSIGTHVRHIVERVGCVLDGLSAGRVNYDQRARNPVLENTPERALLALREARDRLGRLACEADRVLSVCESVHEDCPPAVVPSSLNRELLGLISHTIHHLAIIAILARAQGIPVSDKVGMAPSTLLFQRSAGSTPDHGRD